MKRILTVLLSLTLILLPSCAVENSGETESSSDSTVNTEYTEPQTIRWTDEISMPFPAPNAKEISKGDENSYNVVCTGMTDKDIADYFAVLESEGWHKLNTDTDITMDNYFIKGNDFLDLYGYAQDVTDGSESLSELYIAYSPGYHGDYSDGRKKPDEIGSIIQSAMDADEYYRDYSFAGAVECDLDDAFDRTGVQLFLCFTTGTNENSFSALVLNNNVLMSFSTCFAAGDVDGDGEYEIIGVCGWGSGIYRVTMEVYKVDDTGRLINAYSNTYYPTFEEGYYSLGLELKEKHGKVYLYGTDYEDDADEICYGKFTIKDGKIITTDLFPFSECE